MSLAPRTVGRTTAASPLLQQDLVNTATLVRGRVYYYKDHRFEIGKIVVVDDELATILEDLVEEVSDGDNERFEKPRFQVLRKVPRPTNDQHVDPQKPVVRRLPVRPLPVRHAANR